MSLVVDPAATESAVLALIPAAEPVVGGLRWRLDPTARAGVPAHVTVLYPFVPPSSITDDTVARLRAAVGNTGAVECRFSELGWFADEYLWLAPSPPGPFVALTERVHRAFPDHPPYGGEHDGDVPHLTVGNRRGGTLDALRAAADAMTPQLPVEARVDRLHLLAGAREPDSWRVVAQCPLT